MKRFIAIAVALMAIGTANAQQDKGGISQIEAPIHSSNVALVINKKGETSKVGYKTDANGKKVRYAKKTGEVI